MIGYDQVCTLVRHIAEADGDSYYCCRLPGCSWHGSAGSTPGKQGDTPTASVTVRIPESALRDCSLTPEAGDYMVRGDVVVTSRQDLAGLEYIRVGRVTDNRRGVALRHIKLEDG